MSGYLYILERGDLIRIGTTNKPIEEALDKLPSYLWACDWPKKLEKEIHRHFEEDREETGNEYDSRMLQRLYLFIDSYLSKPCNCSRETARLLKATKEAKPSRQEMTSEERRFDEIDRAHEASRLRREREGIVGREPSYFLAALREVKKPRKSLEEILASFYGV